MVNNTVRGNMMLSQIITELLNPDIDIAVILRKVKILAYQLKLDELKDWVEQELNGYNDRNNVPRYRRYQAVNKGCFIDSHGAQINNILIPLSNLPDKVREVYKDIVFKESIATLENFVRSTSETPIVVEWSADALRLLYDKVYVDFNCISARQIVSRAQLIEVVNAVRNKLLTFLLELQTTLYAPFKFQENINDISLEQARQVFMTVVIGNENYVSTGNMQSVNILKNDLQNLLDYLRKLGMLEKELEELKIALQQDGIPVKENGFGNSVKRWVGTVCGKVANATITISIEQIVKAISLYYGWIEK